MKLAVVVVTFHETTYCIEEYNIIHYRLLDEFTLEKVFII
jgi:hypothetical protein